MKRIAVTGIAIAIGILVLSACRTPRAGVPVSAEQRRQLQLEQRARYDPRIGIFYIKEEASIPTFIFDQEW